MTQYLCIMCMLTTCGYQLSTNLIQDPINTANHIQSKILVHSYDTFNIITRTIKNELILNNIIIFDNLNETTHIDQSESIPILNIIQASENHVVISVFSDGTESEYRIILKIQALLFIPKKENNYPINIYIHRTVIRNPGLALSNFVQDNEIRNEMYQDIAQKLVQQCVIQLQKQ